MNSKDYKTLASLYYDFKDEYEELYNRRIHSAECVQLDFVIADNPAFYMETAELMKKALEITRLDKEIAMLSAKLPGAALQQYINKCLIDEIVITNNIEGVHSTRKEIGEILDDLEGKSSRRFSGLVNKYHALMLGEDMSIHSSPDIRQLYDEIFLSEIVEENPEDEPDGAIFRKDPVSVVSPTQKIIHQGVYPEDRIIKDMDCAISILNDINMEPLFRIAIFHYLFGYIHPFYNGNGRMNRFISSVYLSKTLESIMAYRLSYTVKEHINRYYRAFKIVNDQKNKGDVTPFIFIYLDIIQEATLNLKESLQDKIRKLLDWNELLENTVFVTDKNKNLYQHLLQASLFSEIGISTADLLQYTGLSRPTLKKRLTEVADRNLLIIEKRENNKFYQLNLDALKNA